MVFKLSYEENPSQEDVAILIQGVVKNAQLKKGLDSLDFFSFFIRDENNRVIGGCLGGMLYGGLHIDSLWVNESHRNNGWGTKLVEAALNYGREKNCQFATVNTMDWEALDFYKKLNFEIEFKRIGYEKNSALYFLRKFLFSKEA